MCSLVSSIFAYSKRGSLITHSGATQPLFEYLLFRMANKIEYIYHVRVHWTFYGIYIVPGAQSEGHEGVAWVSLLFNGRGTMSHSTRMFIVWHGHILEETIFYADWIYGPILIVSLCPGSRLNMDRILQITMLSFFGALFILCCSERPIREPERKIMKK